MTQETIALTAKMFDYIVKANEQLVADGKSVIEDTSLGLTELAKANGVIQGKAEILNGMADLLQKFINQ